MYVVCTVRILLCTEYFVQVLVALCCLLEVRGRKIVVRWFSHEVADLQPVLSLLLAQDMQDHKVRLL